MLKTFFHLDLLVCCFHDHFNHRAFSINKCLWVQWLATFWLQFDFSDQLLRLKLHLLVAIIIWVDDLDWFLSNLRLDTATLLRWSRLISFCWNVLYCYCCLEWWLLRAFRSSPIFATSLFICHYRATLIFLDLNIWWEMDCVASLFTLRARRLWVSSTWLRRSQSWLPSVHLTYSWLRVIRIDRAFLTAHDWRLSRLHLVLSGLLCGH